MPIEEGHIKENIRGVYAPVFTKMWKSLALLVKYKYTFAFPTVFDKLSLWSVKLQTHWNVKFIFYFLGFSRDYSKVFFKECT